VTRLDENGNCWHCGGGATCMHCAPVSNPAQAARIAELEARLAEVSHAYDVTFKRRTELELAILPFAEFATNVDDDGWTSAIHREPISTWFGPSDFRAAAKVKA